MTLEACEKAPVEGAAGTTRAKPRAVKRWTALVALLLLTGCREVRVNTLAQGTTTVPGGDQIVVVRNSFDLAKLGLHEPVHF
jgi:hypothetical protein